MTTDIPQRRIDFDFDPGSLPVYWWRDDACVTLFADALSLVFPEGERFLVDSVKRFRDRVKDPVLRARVAGFIGQEAMHGKGHRALNAMVRAHGLDVTEGLEKHIAGLLGFGRTTLSPMGRLAVTCALEHFTATLAEQLLRDARIYGTMHPAIRPLWQWHSVEELEHKSVAYDVYRQMGGGYALRASMMLLTTFLFFVEISHIHMRFLAAKGELLRPRTWLSSVDYFWVRPGVYRRFLPRYLAYFRPGFHPHDRDTASLLDEWRERLFGEQGALRVRDERARQVA